MVVSIQDDILRLQFMGLLDDLLVDKTTGQNIIWGTDTYRDYGEGYGCRDPIKPELIAGVNASVIKTRARKAMEQQSERTRQHAEVFSPFWLCKKMCDYADDVWTGKDWMAYVNSRRLEITCGEAPYLVSRYDVETGEAIPIHDRIGLLDRKLRQVSENTQTEEEWLEWAFRAFRAIYGYDYQGDNVLIARVNLLMTFEEYLWERWNRKPTIAEYRKLITVIAWNLWQMDGLTGMIPYGIAEDEYQEIDWFGMFSGEAIEENKQPRCRVYNWTGGGSVEFLDLPTRGKRAMKFDFIIGNPPYQDETTRANGYAAPVYHCFLDAVYKIAGKAELIHPARFLFNAGSTPKEWNEKMLSDPHIKVLYYEKDSGKIFSNVEIKGGVAVTYRDEKANFGAINVFTVYPELNQILHKVTTTHSGSISNLAFVTPKFNFDSLFSEMPEIKPLLKERRLATNVFDILDGKVFFADLPTNSEQYVKVYGRKGNSRTHRWIKEKYIEIPENLDKYKVLLPKVNGNGEFGETFVDPILGLPRETNTHTFMSIGAYPTEFEGIALLKFIKTKFARALLGVLKTTQHNSNACWKLVPLQDFTPNSDIDWTKSTLEIDQQLYTKYGLDESEMQFIETHVKEME